VVDLAFFGANLFKIVDGGWYPLLVATLIFSVMGIWRVGLRRLGVLTSEGREPINEFLDGLSKAPVPRIAGTAIFLTSSAAETPPLMLHHLEHNRVLHERVILVTVEVDDDPRVRTADRVKIEELTNGFYRIVLHYGFMQSPNVPVALRLCERLGLPIEPDKSTFFLGHEEIITDDTQPMLRQIQTRIFVFFWRNAARATAYYNIPPQRVVAIGLQVEM
jgi:KUP system potassium uptake protein